MVASPTTTAVAQAATTLLTLIARQSVEGESGPDSAAADGNDAAEEDACASGNATDKWGLRIGAIFVILVCPCGFYNLIYRFPRRVYDSGKGSRGVRYSSCRSHRSLVPSLLSSSVGRPLCLGPYGSLRNSSVAVSVRTYLLTPSFDHQLCLVPRAARWILYKMTVPDRLRCLC